MKAPSGPQLPAWFREHIVCWYSPRRQGCTDSSLTADPTLIDLSGKGNDAEICNYNAGTDTYGNKFGCLPDGGLRFSSSGYAQCKTRFALSDFTIIMDRDMSNPTYPSPNPCVAGKTRHAQGTGAFVFEATKENMVASFAAPTYHLPISSSRATVFMTPTNYNGSTIKRGTYADTSSDILVIGMVRPSSDTWAQVRLYSFLLFDKTLSQDQIDYVKNNLID